MRLPFLTRFLTLLLAATGSWSCATSPLHRKEIGRMALPVLENFSWRRGWEFSLTRALARKIRVHSRIPLALEPDCDTVLLGAIRNITVSVAREDQGDRVTAANVTVTVDIRLVRRVSGKVLLARPGLSATGNYHAERGGRQETALREAFDQIAETILEELESPDW